MSTLRLKRQAEATIPTSYGDFSMIAYAIDAKEPMPHLALVAKGFDPSGVVPVRIHSECLTGDVFGSARCDCGEQLDAALHYASRHAGVVLYLRQEGRGIGLINKLKAYNLQDTGFNTAEANTHLGFEVDARQYDCAVQILMDLGIEQTALLTNNPEKVDALKKSPVRVADRIPLVVKPTRHNKDYLRVKQTLMGHILNI